MSGHKSRMEVISGSPQIISKIPRTPPGVSGTAPGVPNPKRRAPMKVIVIAIAAALVIGISIFAGIKLLPLFGGGGGGIKGLYVSTSSENHTLEFKSGGTVNLSYSGLEMSFRYKVSGSDVTFTPQMDDPQGMYAQVAESFAKGGAINEDGSIKIENIGTFVKEGQSSTSSASGESAAEASSKPDAEPQESGGLLGGLFGGDSGGGLSGTYEWAPGAYSKEEHVTVKFSGNNVVFSQNGVEIKATYTLDWPEESEPGTIVFVPEDSSLDEIAFPGGIYFNLTSDIEWYIRDSGVKSLSIGHMNITPK